MGITESFDLTVRSTPQVELTCDVYEPEAAEAAPAVIGLHGGSWRNRYKGLYDDHLRFLAEHGYVGVEGTYRIREEALYPAGIEDVKALIMWVRAHAGEHGIDPDRVGIMGHSAGGHLAALAAMTPDFDRLKPDELSTADVATDVSIQCAVLMNGVYDMVNRSRSNTDPEDIAARFLGGEFEDIPDRFYQASPITYASADAPPTLVMTNTGDKQPLHEDALMLADRLQALGAPADLFCRDGGDHMTFFGDGAHATEGRRRMRSFLDEHL